MVTGDYRPGDVVVDADGWIWVRGLYTTTLEGLPWAFGLKYLPTPGRHPAPEGHATDLAPVRPLTLLIRNGQTVNSRTAS